MAEAKATVRTIDTAFHKLLDGDTRPIPASYRRDSPIEPGPTRVPVARCVSKEFFALEVEKIWKRVWQVACHEDDIRGVGDYVPYDIAALTGSRLRTRRLPRNSITGSPRRSGNRDRRSSRR